MFLCFSQFKSTKEPRMSPVGVLQLIAHFKMKDLMSFGPIKVSHIQNISWQQLKKSFIILSPGGAALRSFRYLMELLLSESRTGLYLIFVICVKLLIWAKVKLLFNPGTAEAKFCFIDLSNILLGIKNCRNIFSWFVISKTNIKHISPQILSKEL